MASQVYFEANGVGNWYDCIAVTLPGESPATAPDKWRVIAIPQCLESTVVDLALAYAQRGDGQSDKSLAIERRFEGQIENLMVRHADFGNLTQPNVFSR